MKTVSKTGTIPWLNAEAKATERVLNGLEKVLRSLAEKTSRSNIHDARIALRHFFALWAVLVQDGWQDSKFEKKIVVQLRRLLDRLGDVRDLDVNLKLGEELGCRRELLRRWKTKRKKQKVKLKDFLNSTDIAQLVEELRTFFRKEVRVVAKHIHQSDLRNESASRHLALVLNDQAKVTQSLSSAADYKALHRLRIAVKNWRYLLEDFGAEPSRQLEKAQQTLGRIHDLGRLRADLQGRKKDIEALTRLSEEMRSLRLELAETMAHMPFDKAAI